MSTRIAWCHETINPAPGCGAQRDGRCAARCYAARLAARLVRMGQAAKYGGLVTDGRFNGRTAWCPEDLAKPFGWRAPRRIFVESMGDLFTPATPDARIAAVFGVMDAAAHHDYLVLTKYPERLRAFVGAWTMERCAVELSALALDLDSPKGRRDPLRGMQRGWPWPPPRAWLGVSVLHRADLPRLDVLRETPAVVRWASFEPLLADVAPVVDLRGLAWVVIGCERGPGGRAGRPMDLRWAERLAARARDAGARVFLKQIAADGRVIDDPAHPAWPAWGVREFPEVSNG